MRALVCLLLTLAFAAAQAQEIARAELPPEAIETLRLIEQGGPFPYRRDGIEFRNFERRLPVMPRGYYREYTVPTPGAKHRGARRIVCGGESPARPDACWYTADHYRSFRKIVP
ncbi:MAG: ribonuclease [Rhodocyclaceae bacterium]|nr:ribonuclease [Rhodocyclaceae bacterium]